MNNTFKCIIAGSRTFNDYALLCEKCDFFLQNKDNVEIVSGGAKGADTLAEQYAKERDFPFTCFPITKEEWKELGKKAGPLRNKEMEQYSEAAILFHDGTSRGTMNMANLMKEAKKPYKVIKFV